MENRFDHEREEMPALEENSRAEPRAHAGSSRHRCTPDGYVVRSELSDNLSVTSDEITLLRAFLSDEINAILHGEDEQD